MITIFNAEVEVTVKVKLPFKGSFYGNTMSGRAYAEQEAVEIVSQAIPKELDAVEFDAECKNYEITEECSDYGEDREER